MIGFRHAGAIELYDAHALIQRADYDVDGFWQRGLSDWPDNDDRKIIDLQAMVEDQRLELRITFKTPRNVVWVQEHSYQGAYAVQWDDEPYQDDEHEFTSSRPNDTRARGCPEQARRNGQSATASQTA